ncbi:MAG: DNA-directed DNA polymerase II small subunit [Archaeoglobaceae archaeon]
MIKDTSSRLIVTKFAMHGYNVHPTVIEILKEEPEKHLDIVVDKACRSAGNSFIITPEDVSPILQSIKSQNGENEAGGWASKATETNGVRSQSQGQKGQQGKDEQGKKGVNVLRDITGRSSCVGNVDDFVMYFNSRYEKLSKILRQRLPPVDIASVKKLKSERIKVIGLITGLRESMNGNTIIELEDKTGRISVVASGNLKEEAQEVLGDEVIGVEGFLRGQNIIAERLLHPEVPMNGNNKTDRDFNMLFMSDTHFGSNTFIRDEWNTFVKWLNCEIGKDKSVNLAESIKYIVIAGDIVDGVGIYPDQDKELDIVDIYEQYEEAAREIEKLPNVKIILAPGNHDAVRQAEPQPALPSEFADLFPSNVMHVGNPCLLDVEGVKLMIYHGRSIDDMVPKLHRVDYSTPHQCMTEMLKRRHLAPVYGNRALIAPEKEDHLVIDEVPDILHCGHVHTYGTTFYKGTFLVNSSCWQAQTEFQKKMNLNPIPGNATVYRPGGDPVRLNFYSGS